MIIAKLLISFPWEHNTDIKFVNFQLEKKFYKVGLCVDNGESQKENFRKLCTTKIQCASSLS